MLSRAHANVESQPKQLVRFQKTEKTSEVMYLHRKRMLPLALVVGLVFFFSYGFRKSNPDDVVPVEEPEGITEFA